MDRDPFPSTEGEQVTVLTTTGVLWALGPTPPETL